MTETGQAKNRIETEQLLRQTGDEWAKALVGRDGDTLNRILAEDFFFAYPMEGDDRTTFINDVVSGAIHVEQLIRENVFVRVWGDTAVLTAKDRVRWSYNGRDFSGHYKVAHIYARRESGWQMVSVQACPIG
jgi:ketosteroid isomerase-like protein